MSLSKHIDTDKLIEQSRDDKARKLVERASGEDLRKYASSPLFGRYGHAPLPKVTIKHCHEIILTSPVSIPREGRR